MYRVEAQRLPMTTANPSRDGDAKPGISFVRPPGYQWKDLHAILGPQDCSLDNDRAFGCWAIRPSRRTQPVLGHHLSAERRRNRSPEPPNGKPTRRRSPLPT